MRTRILITIGDINGIGPEIILKSLSREDIAKRYDITVVTPVSVFEYYYRLLNLMPVKGMFKIVSIGDEKVKIKPGKITKESGTISGLAIKTAVGLCKRNEFDAIVTAPISKKALNIGGYNYSGHTEMLTDLCKSCDSVMVMISKKIIMGFASTHPPLKEAPKLINQEMLAGKLEICYKTLKNDFGISKPQIGVLSLNPHAGESGQIGREEIDIIKPSMVKIRKLHKGLKLEGPFPSDSYFAFKTYNRFDLTFAMYHDQGFIPFKMIAGLKGVNFTAGLPIVRTSPDHGTAYDIAGKNLADEASLVEAIKSADKIFKTRKLHPSS
ncbi:MAG: 4-hydroxythreonine-4-phosphate dehydrogenase PdxA [Ignavibacteria bacterium]